MIPTRHYAQAMEKDAQGSQWFTLLHNFFVVGVGDKRLLFYSLPILPDREIC